MSLATLRMARLSAMLQRMTTRGAPAPVSNYLPRGRHVFADIGGADGLHIDNAPLIELVLMHACHLIGATMRGGHMERFQPAGVTYTITLAESHASIHTYPQHGAYFVDIFTCGEMDPLPAIAYVQAALGGVHREGSPMTIDRWVPS